MCILHSILLDYSVTEMPIACLMPIAYAYTHAAYVYAYAYAYAHMLMHISPCTFTPMLTLPMPFTPMSIRLANTHMFFTFHILVTEPLIAYANAHIRTCSLRLC